MHYWDENWFPFGDSIFQLFACVCGQFLNLPKAVSRKIEDFYALSSFFCLFFSIKSNGNLFLKNRFQPLRFLQGSLTQNLFIAFRFIKFSFKPVGFFPLLSSTYIEICKINLRRPNNWSPPAVQTILNQWDSLYIVKL